MQIDKVQVTPPPTPSAVGRRCVCMAGTVRHKAEVQSKGQRETLFSDVSRAPFAAKQNRPSDH